MAWVNSSTKTIGVETAYSVREDFVRAILLGLFLVLTATFSIREQDPPAALPANAPAESFSAERAVKYLPVIAEKPHPMGSVQHQVVQDYLARQLSDAGLETQVQQATLVMGKGLAPQTKLPVQVGAVQNVLGRLKGTGGGGKAVLLVAHYDSLVNSFGATDNGASVAALLETLRALKSGAPLKNDVIFLFTDVEEDGLLGARAFVAEHPWAQDIGVVLNFDARGNTGPVMMFETSDANGWLVRQLAQATQFPVTHSLSYELYRVMPNDTDLSVFKRVGMAGLNFANIDGISRYHDPLDNLQGVDANSLQHRGDYALALTRQFGNQDLSRTREANAIFFDLFGKFLIHYPSGLVLPLALVITALFVVVVVLGLKRKRLEIGGILHGFVSLFIAMVVASLAGWLLWKGIWLVREGPAPAATQSRLLFVGFVSLALATTLSVYRFSRKRVELESLATGALLWWLLLMLSTSLLLPGASFVFQWPLLFILIGMGVVLLAPQDQQRSRWLNPVVLGLCSVPGLILMAPIIYQIFLGLTLNWVILVLVLAVLLFGFLLPQLQLIAAPFKWALPAAAGAAAIVLLAIGVFANAAGVEKNLDPIYYGLNTDTGKAVWASDLTQHDSRASQFFSSTSEKGSIEDFAYARKSKQYTISSAPLVQLPAPEMSVLEDKSQDGVRTLRLQLTSPRQAATLSFYVDSSTDIASAALNGVPVADEVEAKTPWGIQINGFPQQGAELQLKIKAGEPFKFRLVDQSAGLPSVNAAAQAEAAVISARPDLTFLVKSYSL